MPPEDPQQPVGGKHDSQIVNLQVLPKEMEDKAGQQRLGGAHNLLHQYAVNKFADPSGSNLEGKQITFRRLARRRVHVDSLRRYPTQLGHHVGNCPVVRV